MADPFGVTIVLSGLMLFAPINQSSEMLIMPVNMNPQDHLALTHQISLEHHFELHVHCSDIVQIAVGNNVFCGEDTCKTLCWTLLDEVPDTTGNIFHSISLDPGYDIWFEGLAGESPGLTYNRCHDVCTNNGQEESCFPRLSEIIGGSPTVVPMLLKTPLPDDAQEFIKGRVRISQGTLKPVPETAASLAQQDYMWRVKENWPNPTVHLGRVPNLMELSAKVPSNAMAIRIRPWAHNQSDITIKLKPSLQSNLEVVVSYNPDYASFCQQSGSDLKNFKHFQHLYRLIDGHHVTSTLWPRLDLRKERTDVKDKCKGLQTGNGPIFCYGGVAEESQSLTQGVAPWQ